MNKDAGKVTITKISIRDRERYFSELLTKCKGTAYSRRGKKRKHSYSLPITISEIRLKELRQLSYRDYLQSCEWKTIRRIALRLKRFCEVCKVKKGWQVHHNNYPSRGKERLKDLVVVCGSCHQALHPEVEEREEIHKILSGF